MASLYKQKASRFWWVKYTDPEKGIVRKSLRTSAKAVAKVHLKKYLAAERGQRPAVEDFPSLIDQWHQYNCLTGSDRSGRQNLMNLRVYLASSGVTEPEQITRASVQEWVVHPGKRVRTCHHQEQRSCSDQFLRLPGGA